MLDRANLLKTSLALGIAAAAVPAGEPEDELTVGVATSFSGWLLAFDTNPKRAARS